MSEGKRMLPGFNHDIRHLGRAYHVQTEDLGTGNPNVVTHVFLGGSVVAVRKTSYAPMLEANDPTTSIRELMKRQHEEMVRAVLVGTFDRPAAPAPSPTAGNGTAPAPAVRPTDATQRQADDDPTLDSVILAYLAGDPVERER